METIFHLSECNPGYYEGRMAVCKPCAIGYYKDILSDVECTLCPTHYTTDFTTSDQFTDCSKV